MTDLVASWSEGLWLAAWGLFSKWGFNDGDEPEAYLDWCDERGELYPDDWHGTLRILVHTRLLPALPHVIEVYDIETNHNPIRASSFDGVPVTRDVEYGDTPPPAIEPEGVLVSWEDVHAVATRTTVTSGI